MLEAKFPVRRPYQRLQLFDHRDPYRGVGGEGGRLYFLK